MITIAQEKLIRKLLSEGMPIRAIEKQTGNSERTIRSVRDSPAIRSRAVKSKPHKMITVEKENEIRSRLDSGDSIAKICRDLKAARETVWRVRDSKGPLRRACYNISEKRKKKCKKKRGNLLLNNLEKARRCPDCGAMVLFWPCLLCNPNTGCY